MSTVKNPFTRSLWLALALLLPALPAAAQDDEGSYGYFRVLEGSATLVERDAESEAKTRSPIEINQPVLAGDQVLVAPSSRLEVVLPDGTLVRLDGGSDLTFERIAGSPDSDDPSTLLTLAQGELQLVVPADFAGDEPPRIDTPNATFYPRGRGVFRISAENEDWSSLLVREGSAEAVTRRGSLIVRADEEALIEGDEMPRAEVQTASSTDGLERWARRLDEEAGAASEYVADDLRYEAAPLARYGTWVDVEGSRYWRPTSVDPGWRPFWHGRWVYTPSGLTWIPYEPWGWVTAHYGSWDYLPHYGWAWRPGHVYSPGWVYWYWGPRYVGWCPTGYYTRFYGRRHHGFRFGVYGWAGGDWGAFGDWHFVRSDRVGSHDQNRWTRRGRDLGRDGAGHRLDRGLITTDTRPVDIGRYREPADRLRILRERRGGGGEELPDVTPFIARQPELPPRVLRNVVADGPGTQVLERTSPRPERPARAGRRAGGIGESGGAESPAQPWRLRTRTGESPQPARERAGSTGTGAGTDDETEWRERSGRPRIEFGGGNPGRRPADAAPAERTGQGDAGERAARERPRRTEPGDDDAGGAEESAPRGRLRTVAPEERPSRERVEEQERRREEPRQAEPEERPDRGASSERNERADREERREERREVRREESPRAQAPQERPQPETRERSPEPERPRTETRERHRDRDRGDQPPARSVRRSGDAGEELTPRRPGQPDQGEAWRRRAEGWRQAEPGPTAGTERREVRSQRPDPGAAGRESWRPRAVEPASPRGYTAPTDRRPAQRPIWTPRQQPQTRPQRPAYTPPRVSAPPPTTDRSAPSARPAPRVPREQPANRGDRGDRGQRGNRPRGGGR